MSYRTKLNSNKTGFKHKYEQSLSEKTMCIIKRKTHNDLTTGIFVQQISKRGFL